MAAGQGTRRSTTGEGDLQDRTLREVARRILPTPLLYIVTPNDQFVLRKLRGLRPARVSRCSLAASVRGPSESRPLRSRVHAPTGKSLADACCLTTSAVLARAAISRGVAAHLTAQPCTRPAHLPYDAPRDWQHESYASQHATQRDAVAAPMPERGRDGARASVQKKAGSNAQHRQGSAIALDAGTPGSRAGGTYV